MKKKREFEIAPMATTDEGYIVELTYEYYMLYEKNGYPEGWKLVFPPLYKDEVTKID